MRELELGIFNDSIRLSEQQIVTALREVLGVQLTAYVSGVRETRAVSEWEAGSRRPLSGASSRLRLAYRLSRLVQHGTDSRVVRAWFKGANPSLGGLSPAKIIRENQVDFIESAVLMTARGFATATATETGTFDGSTES